MEERPHRWADVPTAAWSTDDSHRLYRLDEWAGGYFAINDAGHVVVWPTGRPELEIDLKTLIDDLRRRDVRTPMLLRFSDLLQHRAAEIAGAFDAAIERFGYRGEYACVYPIKVNQQRHVVEEVLRFGKVHGFGLEAGSKPELLAIMALVDDNTTPIICNGYKDEAFLEAVVLAGKIGRNIIPVIEKFSELETLLRQAKAHGVRPQIGVRVKLSALGAGRWQQSGGARSKFGLFISETLDLIQRLREHDMLDCLQLLHFHIGSQINDVRAIKSAINELSRVYVEMSRAGASLKYLDVGGGLGVDYDGSTTSTDSSMNYDLAEYANNVVFHIGEVCDDAGVAHPTILSESGRALVAHHSVLVFDVIGVSAFDRFAALPELTNEELVSLPMPVRTLYESQRDLGDENFIEYYHDAQLNREEVLNLFRLGHCTLEQRGLGERSFYAIAAGVLRRVRGMDNPPAELADLEAILADTYFCNTSIFQSLPDTWAIGQLFPIMPLHRHRESPNRRGVLADVTCDSDGKIDRFIAPRDTKPVLELHPYKGGDYLLGAFLVGAYQETLGDLHNLFGDTDAVHIKLGEDGRPVIDEIVPGDTAREVLGYVQYDTNALARAFRRTVETAIRDEKLTLDEAGALRRFYENGLAGYTYLGNRAVEQ